MGHKPTAGHLGRPLTRQNAVRSILSQDLRRLVTEVWATVAVSVSDVYRSRLVPCSGVLCLVAQLLAARGERLRRQPLPLCRLAPEAEPQARYNLYG